MKIDLNSRLFYLHPKKKKFIQFLDNSFLTHINRNRFGSFI